MMGRRTTKTMNSPVSQFFFILQLGYVSPLLGVLHDDHESSLLDVLQLAADFNRETCASKISETWSVENFQQFCYAHKTSEVYELDMSGKKSVYVRNYKVGSHMITSNIYAMTNHSFKKRRVGVFKKTRYPPTTLIWSMVRDPWAKAVSGYMEVMIKVDNLNGLGNKLREQRDPATRFKSFLQAEIDGNSLGKSSYHSWPQALLLDVLHSDPKNKTKQGMKRVDALVRLENSENELLAVLRHAGAENVELRAGIDENHHTHADKIYATNIPTNDSSIMELFCALFEVDYVCLPSYTPPSMCLELYPGFATGLQPLALTKLRGNGKEDKTRNGKKPKKSAVMKAALKLI